MPRLLSVLFRQAIRAIAFSRQHKNSNYFFVPQAINTLLNYSQILPSEMHYNKQCDKKRNYSYFPFSSYTIQFLFISALFSVAVIFFFCCGSLNWFSDPKLTRWGSVYVYVSAHIWQVILCWLSLHFAWLP